jgi:hypothetical protein
MKLRFFVAATLALLSGISSGWAATITTDEFGKLIGAHGVNVGGTLYDVEFNDASCAEIFSGCDSLNDFDFTTQSAALAASQALLDQVSWMARAAALTLTQASLSDASWARALPGRRRLPQSPNRHP